MRNLARCVAILAGRRGVNPRDCQAVAEWFGSLVGVSRKEQAAIFYELNELLESTRDESTESTAPAQAAMTPLPPSDPTAKEELMATIQRVADQNRKRLSGGK